MNSMFAPQVPQQQWNGLNTDLSAHLQGLGALGPYIIHQQQQQQQQVESAKLDAISGIGILTWLSAKAGLITCKDNMVISFQLKDFCDQILTDLTSVLRVGFTLSFKAELNENEYTATLVQPIYGTDADMLFANSREIDLESSSPAPPTSKDAYSIGTESKAIPALLTIFQRHGLQQIQLSSLHSQMSNCGDDELFRYVGTSSLKRRQFVERRTHLFRLQNDDTIILQNPAVYVAVCSLASFLLRRGGATAIQTMFDFYVNSPAIQQEVRDQCGINRQDFLELIQAHNWIFALFPNRTYVSVRRNLPPFDYQNFIAQNFPDLDTLSRAAVIQRTTSASMYGHQPRSIQRTMSVQQTMNGANGAPVFNPTPGQRQTQMARPPSVVNGISLGQQVSSSIRPQSLWEAQTPLSQASNTSTQWNPLFPSAWSNSVLPLGSSDPLASLTGSSTPNSIIAPSYGKPTMVSTGTQAGGALDGVGREGCMCSCTCGANGPFSRGSVSSTSPSSNSPAATFEPFPASIWSAPDIGSIGSIGDKLTPINLTNMSSGPATASSSTGSTSSSNGALAAMPQYDPFGSDFFNGTHIGSLRI